MEPELPPVAATSIAGLDLILHGGLPREDMHMVQGTAGAGKTTMALQFLREGVRLGEPCVYVTLSQSKVQLERIARSHGWTLNGINVHELTPGTVAERVTSRQTILPTGEIELEELFHDLEAVVEQVKPVRAVIDSIAILQLLTGGTHRYRHEVVTLRQLFVECGCTVLMIADDPATSAGEQPAREIFHPLCGVVIDLSQQFRPFGDVRRQLRVIKARGLPNDGGIHDFKILVGGLEVYARLGAYQKEEYENFKAVPSHLEGLDQMLGGGLQQGTSCLMVGPSGAGKSTLASLFAASAADRGDHVAIFLFDERPETYKVRAESLGIPLRRHIDAGRIILRQIDTAEIAPGEFTHQVSESVIKSAAKVVIIDSIAGYFTAIGISQVFLAQLHELLTFLSRSGVLTILCATQEGFMSVGAPPGVDVSYLSDTILLLTYYESEGELHQCVTAVKRRHGEHESVIRELILADGKVQVGQPLRQYRDLLLRNGQSKQPSAGERP